MTESEPKPGSKEFKIVLDPNDALLIQTLAHFNKMTQGKFVSEALRVGAWYYAEKTRIATQELPQERPAPDFPIYDLKKEFPWGEDMRVSVERPMITKLRPRNLFKRNNKTA